MADFLGQYKDNYEEAIKVKETQLSKIYTALNINQNRTCFLKAISKEQIKKGDYDFLLEKINREEQLTKLCHWKNVVELYKKLETNDYFIFELEYCESNLYERYINKYGGLQGEGNKKLLREIILDLARALEIMHEYDYF